jgi:hypothetical protein
MALIETLLMANHAEIHDGLLYLMGAGWADLHLNVLPDQPPAPFHFGVGMTVTVGWAETTRRHRVLMYLEPEDGGPELFRIDAELQTADPVGDSDPSDTRGVLAVNGEAKFVQPGRYHLVAELGDDVRHVSFRVHHEPMPG